MAAAARPGPSDARVPCPLCGGLIHPIAGKCKHCKADLASYHAPRAAAATPLPSLRGAAAPVPPPSAGQVHWIGKPPAAGEPAPTASTPPPRSEQPVLPPRPTLRGRAAEPSASSWRSWPVIVIVLAMVAIVAAVVLMVLPAGHDEDKGKRSTATAPAPERMDTAPNVVPPAPQPTPTPAPKPAPKAAPTTPDQDPWADPQGVPPAAGSSADNTTPDADDSDAVDPLGAPHGQPHAGNRRRLNLNPNAAIMMTMAAHLCHKMAQCGASDASTLQICNTLSSQAPPAPTNCPAATRCLKAIDGMSCANQSGDLSQIPTLFTQFVDCGAAAQC